MSSESIRYECPPTCPKVKKYLRAAIEEAPWLLDDIFPQKIDVQPQLPDITREREIQNGLIDAIYKRPVDYHEKIEVTPSKAIEDIEVKPEVQEEAIVQERVVIPTEKIVDRDEDKIDLVEEKEISIVQEQPVIPKEKIVYRDEDKIDLVEEEEISIVQEQPVIPTEKIVDRDEDKIDLVKEEEISIVQEQPVIPTEKIKDRDEEKIDLVEEEEISIIQDEQPVISMERIADEEKIEEKELAERIVAEPVKQISEIVEEELELELQELKEYFEAERRVENGEEEGATDYEKFIDEELQEFLPALIAKEIPEEPRAMPREISRNAADLYEKIDRPRKPEEASRAEEEEVMVSAKVKRIFPRKPADVCDDTCPLIKEQKGKLIFQEEEKRQYCRLPRKRIMRKLKERQRVVDHYRLTKGFSYFEDVCTCSLACMVYTLSRDPFVRSVFASLALFAVGLKLCSELDAWEMPSRVS